MTLNKIKKNNQDVFEALFEQYYPHLVKFAEGYLHDLQSCEDIVQSFFISLWTNSDKLSITSSPKSYFFTSVKNLCLNKLRDLKVQDKHQVLYIESLINSDAENEVVDPEIFRMIRNAVDELPPQMAEIFQKRYYEGKQLKEIAAELNIVEGTVKTQLFRARSTLRDKLQKSTKIILVF
ncbi:RNA polymerase sigma-70 factor [Maribellus sp. CM-23]|uniref:RNA polymerase sigma factor n=1 Tax=Maribellus sp. CM-23 TaxID=2781026 RepID=UPI001F46DE1F|nr:RNA polymerase sigma-70 factor [Maribellus sp. CM-23]MCE4566408.1 RNA polymerase sigma-70 factor [Maribellus sp. CM-23]